MPKDDRFKREKFRKLRQDARRLAAERAQWLWFGAALLAITGHRVGDDFSAIGLMAQLATKKIIKAKAWTSDEDGRLRKLVISNAPAFDIAADLGRTVTAVIGRAQALRIPRRRSRGTMKVQ